MNSKGMRRRTPQDHYCTWRGSIFWKRNPPLIELSEFDLDTGVACISCKMNYYEAMKETHPSENEKFFNRGPEQGTPEFEEAKKEAGVGNWFEVFERNVERAQSTGDKVLLENSVRAMEKDLVNAVAGAMEKGDFSSAHAVLDKLEVFADERHLDIAKNLRSQREGIVQEQLDELEKMGVKGVMNAAHELFSPKESFGETDANIIFGLAQSLVKSGACGTLEDAIIQAAVKRWEARPRKHDLFLAVEREGFLVSGTGETPFEAARKSRGNA